MEGLAGKNAVITGASRGIGRAIAVELAKHGVNIAFNFVSDANSAQTLSEELHAKGISVLAMKADMKSDQDIEAFVKAVKAKFNRVDFLINNAGILRDKSLLFMSHEDWNEVIDTNLSGIFRITRLLIAGFLKQGHGNIVNISSTAGLVGNAGQANYSASKAGVIGFSKALAKEVASHNVRVNVVAPGFIQTDMVSRIPQIKMDSALKSIPMKRVGNPQEVAKAVVFLLSDDSSYMTGQVVPVDGGLAI